MKTVVQKWGNSLALRIPKTFADEIGLSNNLTVEVIIKKGKLVITPLNQPEFTLTKFLEQVNENNVHNEINTGPSLGNETW